MSSKSKKKSVDKVEVDKEKLILDNTRIISTLTKIIPIISRQSEILQEEINQRRNMDIIIPQSSREFFQSGLCEILKDTDDDDQYSIRIIQSLLHKGCV